MVADTTLKTMQAEGIQDWYEEQSPKLKKLQTFIFASMSLNLSKSVSEALLFCTISFLPQELLSHLFFTSGIVIQETSISGKDQYRRKQYWSKFAQSSPAASMAWTRVFFLGTLLISILISVRESLLKFIWVLTISGASTRAWTKLDEKVRLPIICHYVEDQIIKYQAT